MVYIGTEDGLCCLSSINGEIIWFYPTSTPIVYTPACDTNRLYFGAADALYCLNPQNGELIFQAGLGDSINGHLTIFGDYLYLVAGKRLFTFDWLNCRLLWQTDTLGPGFDNQAPAVDDSGNIYVVTLDNRLDYDYRIYKINPNGQQVWMKEELHAEPGELE